jgi:L-fuculose-phosphate aldolase
MSNMLNPTATLEKPELIDIAKKKIASHLSMPAWTVRQKLALTCRILHSKGHESGLAGQISSRGEALGTLVTQQLGLGFDEITASNLLTVDYDLNVLEGEGMANPANRFHTWLYNARPDINCIIHTHPTHSVALAMLERPLQIAYMDVCVLYDDVGFLPVWTGVPVGNEEGKAISAALGTDKHALLLAHHGLLVTGRTVEEACAVAVMFERAAQLQLLCESAGQIKPIEPELGRQAHDWILQERRSQATFHYYARQYLRSMGAGDTNPLDGGAAPANGAG